MNECFLLWLIGPTADDGYLPTEPFERGWSRRRVKVGCTNLRCNRCGRQIRRLAHAEATTGPEAARRIYAAPDLAAHPDVRPAASRALYLCQCCSHAAAGAEEAPEGLDYLRLMPRDYWTCGGHPPWELPAVLEGVAIHPGMDFPALVARLPLDFWPPPLPPLKEVDLCGLWLARLWHLLGDQNATMRQELVTAVTRLFADPQPARRAMALGFVEGCAEFATEKMVESFREHLTFFVGHSDPTRPGGTLEERMVRILRLMLPSEGADPSDPLPGAQAALSLLQTYRKLP